MLLLTSQTASQLERSISSNIFPQRFWYRITATLFLSSSDPLDPPHKFFQYIKLHQVSPHTSIIVRSMSPTPLRSVLEQLVPHDWSISNNLRSQRTIERNRKDDFLTSNSLTGRSCSPSGRSSLRSALRWTLTRLHVEEY